MKTKTSLKAGQSYGGIVENSDIDVESLAIGGSWLFDNGFFGATYLGRT